MDGLPPRADHEERTIARLMASFGQHGYQRVSPPMVEFEDGLLRGASAALSPHTFRLMDPVSQRMMGLRADITGQIARIASTRLHKWPRPLRLSYAGSVLRVRGTDLRPEREYVQAGVELIGADTAAADVEVIVLAAEALRSAGVQRVSIDLTLPTLVPAVLAATDLAPEDHGRVRRALDQKDGAALAQAAGPAAVLLETLLSAGGRADAAVEVLRAADLPATAAEEIDRLAAVVADVTIAEPDLQLTVDAVENTGFEYHTGVSFTVYAPGVRGELGRGGRYRAGAAGEPATGCSLYIDTLLRAIDGPAPARLLWLPVGTDAETARRLRGEGWRTVKALAPTDDDAREAHRLGCTHRLGDDGPMLLDGQVDGGEE